MKTLRFAVALAMIAALLLFALQNARTVELRFLGWEWRLSLAIPVLLAFFIGGFAARPVLRFLNERRKERSRDKQLQKAAAKRA